MTLACYDPTAGVVFSMFPAEIERLIVDVMDFPLLMKFRAVSRTSLRLVKRTLRKEFIAMLSLKVPKPKDLEVAMEELEAYAGGYSALSFFTRSRLSAAMALELFLGRDDFDLMRRHMLEVQRAVCVANKAVANDTGVLRMSLWHTSEGRVMLYRSMTRDAILPILRGSSSAVMNYVGPLRFGVMWPRLTFKWRALPGSLYDGPSSYMKAIRDLGFTVRLYPWMWGDEGDPQSCAADRFICPAQPRYVHDGGSFRGTWEPGTVEPLVVSMCIRLDTRPCRGVCQNQHIHLSNASHVAWF